jgi:hypothetical protein
LGLQAFDVVAGLQLDLAAAGLEHAAWSEEALLGLGSEKGRMTQKEEHEQEEQEKAKVKVKEIENCYFALYV